MIIQIKQALLEGYNLESIVEAVHANHPNLNKRRLKDPATSYKEGKEIEKNRKKLSDEIKGSRDYRDELRKSAAAWKRSNLEGSDYAVSDKTKDANYFDNGARARSQTGGKHAEDTAELENINFPKTRRILQNVPRVISSAKE